MPPRSRVIPFIAVPIVGLTVFAAAACRPSRSGDGAGGRPLRIAVIPIGTTHEFWKSVRAGALAAARELGVEILWKGPLKEDDRNEQIQIVETLAGSGVDALVLSPLDDRALMRPVAEARRDGIPTVIFNSALQGEEHAAFIATDNFLGGTLAAREVGRRTGGRGRLIMVRLMVGVEGTTKREEGFLATLRAEYPGIEVVSENQYAGPSTETAYQTMENLLARFGPVDAVFTPNESTTFGCLRALQDHGLAGKIVHVGFDASEKLTEALAKGEIAGLVLQDPVAMGYRSVKTAVAIVRG
ncbi:MAG: sugar ABC transporter substrate-binding protein, partial [Candidatus Aminicenantes bacterium]